MRTGPNVLCPRLSQGIPIPFMETRSGRNPYGKEPSMKRRDFVHATVSAGLILGSARFLHAVTGKTEPASRRARGLATGLRELDDLLGGLRRGELVALAGPSGAGKTGLSAQVAAHAAVGLEVPVAWLSLEDFSDDLRRRMACQLACVDSARERIGPMSDEEARRLAAAAAALRAAPLSIDAGFRLCPDDVAALARRRAHEGRAELIVVDHVPGLLAAGNRDGARDDRGRTLRQGLRALARELDVPILAIAQTRTSGEACGAAADGADRVLRLRRVEDPAMTGGFQGREAVLVEGAREAGRARLCFDSRSGRLWSREMYPAIREGVASFPGCTRQA